jgi:mannose-6-phosphate isomerase
MNEKVYRLTPSLHDNIWGGDKLREYGKTSESDRIAESWELSFTKGGEAKIADGRTLSEAFPKKLWGKNAEKFDFFPVLTKFIDAREKLSVQVHPNDEYALENEGQYGKSEMWYIVDADEGAGIYMGLSKECDKEEFSRAVADGTVENFLSFKKVRPGEVYFIPAGTVHAICEGVLIYEIQQNSTLTYRLYDYMRRDKNGNLRELHVERAMKVAELKPYEKREFSEDGGVIGSCEYFETRELTVKGKTTLTAGADSYLFISVISGEGEISGELASRGDSFFAPANSGEISLSGNMKIITVKTP